jgi:hypothetical protein
VRTAAGSRSTRRRPSRPGPRSGTRLRHGKHLNHFDAGAPADPGWTNFDILLEPATDFEDFTFFDGDSFSDDYVTTRLDERTVANIDAWAGVGPS